MFGVQNLYLRLDIQILKWYLHWYATNIPP
jgi:hypothetical protein